MREEYKHRLKRSGFLRSLTYDELKEAHLLIERGVDYALLYFWFNLKQLQYWPLFKLIDVEKEATYFAKRNPEFEKDIVQWFLFYEKQTKNLYGGTTNRFKRGAA